MICRPCRDGADLRTDYKAGKVIPLPDITGDQVYEMIRSYHAQCEGCDCQHSELPKVLADEYNSQ